MILQVGGLSSTLVLEPQLVASYKWLSNLQVLGYAQVHQTTRNQANYNDLSRRVVTLNGGLIRELPQNPLNSGLGIILICPEGIFVEDIGGEH